jgi:hypothetical protein
MADKIKTYNLMGVPFTDCSQDKWEQYWKQKLGIDGNLTIQINKAEIRQCHNF